LRGSVSPYAQPCGGVQYVCPLGSSAPMLVPLGWYSNEDTREDLRSAVTQCEIGYYCPGDGRRYKCPGGTYTDEVGTVSRNCKGDCLRGYYCLEGSSSPIQHACGNSSVYCVRGSAWPTIATPGFYTVPTGDDAGAVTLFEGNTTHSIELPCEPGYYCVKGIKFPCPPGTFGWRYGMTDSSCGGQVNSP
jgi:hypothetical protein